MFLRYRSIVAFVDCPRTPVQIKSDSRSDSVWLRLSLWPPFLLSHSVALACPLDKTTFDRDDWLSTEASVSGGTTVACHGFPGIATPVTSSRRYRLTVIVVRDHSLAGGSGGGSGGGG
ncbi:unnamed protein product, partial [Heterotrigona itama]